MPKSLRRSIIAIVVLALGAAPRGQSRQIAPGAQHIAVIAGESADVVVPGQRVSLWVDVTPRPKIHVYAPGAKDFLTVALVMSKQGGLAFGKPAYPAGELLPVIPGTDERVLVYRKLFRITQPLTVAKAAKRGGTLTISGTVNYQACDDRVCFPPASAPVSWTLKIR